MTDAFLKLDAKDKKLIGALELDGRLSFSQLGKKMGVSQEVAQYRYHRLVDAGILYGFELIVNNYLLGQQQFRILLSVSAVMKQTVLSYCKSHKQMLARELGLSKWNIDVAIWAPSSAAFSEICDELFEKFPDAIIKRSLFVVTARHSQLHTYLHGQSKRLSCTQGTSVSLDDGSRALLRVLSRGARKELLAAAKECHMPTSTALYKLRDLMKKKVIIGTRVFVSKAKLGYDGYQVYLSIKSPRLRRKCLSWLEAQPNVLGIRELIGEFDLEVSADFTSGREFNSFLSVLSKAIPEMERVETNMII